MNVKCTLIGGVIGFIFGGPIGAFTGVVLGFVIDKICIINKTGIDENSLNEKIYLFAKLSIVETGFEFAKRDFIENYYFKKINIDAERKIKLLHEYDTLSEDTEKSILFIPLLKYRLSDSNKRDLINDYIKFSSIGGLSKNKNDFIFKVAGRIGIKRSLVDEKITNCMKRYNNISLDVMESINELGLPFIFTKNELKGRYTSLIDEYKNLEKRDVFYSNKIETIDKAYACLLKYNQEV